MTPGARKAIFLGACAVAIALPVLYVSLARSTPPSVDSARYDRLTRVPAGGGILFRSTVPDSSFGKIAFVSSAGGNRRWLVSDVTCDRVYYQRGRGLCEVIDPDFIPPYAMFVFDDTITPQNRRPLSGVPNRARISPDGRRAAVTVFVTGHSYAEGGFSTATLILDAATGAPIADLESFAVERDGQSFNNIDFNFWGVTFTSDGNRFYATLRTQNVNYLIEGDVDKRQARVLHAGVECPSLSPDGTRIAFKKRIENNATVFWKVAILDLNTMQETVLEAEERSVDDQVDWLDDQHVIYHLPKSGGADVWSLRVDQREAPRLLIEGGFSPAVLR